MCLLNSCLESAFFPFTILLLVLWSDSFECSLVCSLICSGFLAFGCLCRIHCAGCGSLDKSLDYCRIYTNRSGGYFQKCICYRYQKVSNLLLRSDLNHLKRLAGIMIVPLRRLGLESLLCIPWLLRY